MKTFIKIIATIAFLLFAFVSIGQHPTPEIVKDINFESANGVGIVDVVNLNGTLFFSGNNGTNGAEPWISDGTSAGTKMLKNVSLVTGISTYDGASSPRYFTALGNKIIFTASYLLNTTLSDNEVFISDGTEAGTLLLKNVNATGLAGSNPSNPYYYTTLGSRTLFVANDGINGNEIWVTDGTTSGTTLLKDCNPGAASSNPIGLVKVGDKIYFSATNASGFYNFYVSDGTIAGTSIFKENCFGQSLIEFNGSIYFDGKDNSGAGQELWVSNGTTSGTQLFLDINPGVVISSPSSFFVYHNKLFFTAYHNVYGRELWVTDGTISGTYMVKDIFPGAENGNLQDFTIYNDKIFFAAKSDATDAEIWVSDGTTAGTMMYADVNPGAAGSDPKNLFVYNNRLYFVAKSADLDKQLWCIEGNSTVPFKIKPSGSNVTSSFDMLFNLRPAELNGSIYFPAKYFNNVGLELYKMTTTPYELPTAIKDVNPSIKLEVYPNPTSNFVSIKVDKAIVATICNSLGKIVKTIALEKGINKIDVSDVSVGQYWIKPTKHANSISFIKQ